MKILSYEIKGDTLFVVTDNESRPHFTYPKNKFRNAAELKREIQKSIDAEERRAVKEAQNLTNLTASLDTEVQK